MLQSELARLVLTRTQTIGAVLTRFEDERWVNRQRGLSRNQFAASIIDEGRSALAVTCKHLDSLGTSSDLVLGLDALQPILLDISHRAARSPHGTCRDHWNGH
jgi:DNA-binding MarR family transcriptional regulator